MDTCGSQDQMNVRFPPGTSDERLVAVAKSGDRSSFAELWKRHSRTAFGKVYQITKNRADAEDVIQDAWIKAFIHLNAFDGRANFRPGSPELQSIRRSWRCAGGVRTPRLP